MFVALACSCSERRAEREIENIAEHRAHGRFPQQRTYFLGFAFIVGGVCCVARVDVDVGPVEILSIAGAGAVCDACGGFRVEGGVGAEDAAADVETEERSDGFGYGFFGGDFVAWGSKVGDDVGVVEEGVDFWMDDVVFDGNGISDGCGHELADFGSKGSGAVFVDGGDVGSVHGKYGLLGLPCNSKIDVED